MFDIKYIVNIAAFTAGVFFGGLGTKTAYSVIIIPAMLEAAELSRAEAVNQCEQQLTSAVTIAAERAKLAERAQLEARHDAATMAYNAALQYSLQRLEAAHQDSEEKDKRYESQLSKARKSCPLDRRALDYLNGVRSEK